MTAADIAARLETPIRRRTVAAAVAAVVLFAVALAWCVVALGDRAEEQSAADGRKTLREQAGTVVATVFSADAATWQRDRDAARAVVAEPLSASVVTALRSTAPTGVASIRWVPRHVAVTGVDGDLGTAVVAVTATVTDTAGKAAAQNKTVNATFSRRGDRWLLNGLDELQ